MDLVQILGLLAGGCAAGFLAGFFGVGGGVVLVPILLVFYGLTGVSSLVSTHMAFGTSLLIIVFASLSSARQYHANGHVVWNAVLIIGLASVVGSVAGAQLAGVLPGKVLRQIFAGVVLLSAVRLLLETRNPRDEGMPKVHPLSLVGTGEFVGVGSSLAGVGGGVLSIPIMHSILHFPLKRALGTSSATIVLTAAAAAVGYVMTGLGNDLISTERLGFPTLGYVDYLHAIPLILGSIPLAAIGAKVAHRTNAGALKRIFAIFLILMAVRMFFF